NFSGYRVVGSCLLQSGTPLGLSLIVAAVENLDGIGGRFPFLGHNSSLLMRVLVRVPLEVRSVSYGPVNFLGRHLPLFDKPVGKDDSGIAVKEVKHPVIHPLKPYPKFVNSVPQVIPLGPPQLMAQLPESLDLHPALVL